MGGTSVLQEAGLSFSDKWALGLIQTQSAEGACIGKALEPEMRLFVRTNNLTLDYSTLLEYTLLYTLSYHIILYYAIL